MGLGRALLLQGKTEAALQEMQQEKDEIWRLSDCRLCFTRSAGAASPTRRWRT